jgi:hypothetical protein
LARRRDAERLPPFRAARFREALFRLDDLRPPDRDDLRALFRAELRPPRLADLPARLADRRALFLAPLRADFLRPRLAERLEDLLRDARRLPPVLSLPLLGEGSPKSNEGDDDAGVGEGVLSEGSGSIHPEPDQPISI